MASMATGQNENEYIKDTEEEIAEDYLLMNADATPGNIHTQILEYSYRYVLKSSNLDNFDHIH
jgi:hypothetical protein